MERTPRFHSIKTHRDGIWYRSRLESRWGAFWRHLSVPAEYEPGGVDIGDETLYLVDFWLPSWGVYAEIKPTGIDLGVATERVRALARAQGCCVLLIVGPPGQGLYTVDMYGERDGDQYRIEGGHFGECPRCEGFGIVSEWGWTELGEHPCTAPRSVPLHDPAHAPRLFSAYQEAWRLHGDDDRLRPAR